MTGNEKQAVTGTNAAYKEVFTPRPSSDRAAFLARACGKKITPRSFRILSDALRDNRLNQSEKAALICHLSMMDWNEHRRCAAWLLAHTGAMARNLAVNTDKDTSACVSDMILTLGHGIRSTTNYWRPHTNDFFAAPVPEDELMRDKEIFEEMLSADAEDAVEDMLLTPYSMTRRLRIEDINIRLNIII